MLLHLGCRARALFQKPHFGLRDLETDLPLPPKNWALFLDLVNTYYLFCFFNFLSTTYTWESTRYLPPKRQQIIVYFSKTKNGKMYGKYILCDFFSYLLLDNAVKLSFKCLNWERKRTSIRHSTINSKILYLIILVGHINDLLQIKWPKSITREQFELNHF